MVIIIIQLVGGKSKSFSAGSNFTGLIFTEKLSGVDSSVELPWVAFILFYFDVTKKTLSFLYFLLFLLVGVTVTGLQNFFANILTFITREVCDQNRTN